MFASILKFYLSGECLTCPALVLVLGTEIVSIKEEVGSERGIKVGHTGKRERKRRWGNFIWRADKSRVETPQP